MQTDVCTIEFQKRGLPHVHILIWLKKPYKCLSANDIDSIISAEIPNKNSDPLLYQIVNQFMIHGPCGQLNQNSPCMRGGKCSKFFPKQYKSETIFETNAFPVYRRRDDPSKFVIKNGMQIDNSFVVPYNSDLLLRYNAHINVESCCQSMLIKYLFKYINKGSDRARIVFEENSNNEILAYLNCRYISPYEAVWRLFEYPIHMREPPVERLPVHLPLEQTIVFNSNQSLESIVDKKASEHTMLTSWFETNKFYPEARTLTYAELPSKFVWESRHKIWKPRKRKGGSIGRIAYVHPASGELYYLRMLLNIQKGVLSFDDIRTVNGIIQPSYQDACKCLGLLGDDKEWIEALGNAVNIATSHELRQLFVTMILFCEIANPLQLFNSHWQNMCDDILYDLRKSFAMPTLNLSELELKNSLLFELEQLFNASSSSLKDHNLPMPNERKMSEIRNKLLREELNYNCDDLSQEHSVLVTQLNEIQKFVYDCVISTVNEKKSGLFFVYGHGGTGKTFLWHTIISKIRSEGKIVLAVASSGIASLLLPSGRTAHSRFKIPLTVTECSTCHIKKGTHLAKLIEKADLIIWDEAPMNHKHCFEALDKSLSDILSHSNNSNKSAPFGGKPFLLGGDFRQILPVIPGGTKEEIIDASLNNSYLWPFFKVFQLKENMRLSQKELNNDQKKKLADFATWILQIGDGQIGDILDSNDKDTCWIQIPDDLLIQSYSDPIRSIFSATYPNFENHFASFEYLRERAIITPKNNTVAEINDYAIDLLPGQKRIYLSSDSLYSSSENFENLCIMYPTEFLNTLEFNGLPSHKLILKIGMPIMLLRNLNQSIGLCNGTRLVVTQLFDRIIEARILAGSNINYKVYIPRITLTATENKWPFVFKRRQFPIRPCYAMTINKSQGQSLKQVGLYLPQPVFTHGQLYVALSRVTSREGLKVLIANNNEMPNTFTKNIVYKDVLQNLTTGCSLHASTIKNLQIIHFDMQTLFFLIICIFCLQIYKTVSIMSIRDLKPLLNQFKGLQWIAELVRKPFYYNVLSFK